jgi:hypothetical protein
MKEKELRELAECGVCHKPFGHTGIPLFWRVRVTRYGINLRTVKAQDGLAQMMGGSSELAAVMGPDKDMASPVMGPVEVTVCEACANDKLFMIMAIAEASETKKE